MGFDGWRDVMRGELEQIEDDLHYTERTYFDMAHHYQRLHVVGGIAAAVLAAVSGAAVIVSWSETVAAVAALAASVVSIVLTFLRPDREAEQYLAAGRQLAGLRTQVKHALALDLPAGEFEIMRAVLEELRSAKEAVLKHAPPTSDRHFERTRGRIQAGLYKKDERGAS